MGVLLPFIVLLIVALIVNYIPMEATFKNICNIVIGVVALLMLLQFAHIV